LNPDTAMQNLLRGDVRHNGNTSIFSRSIARKCDIQRWVRRLAVHEERWMSMWPLKLRNISSTISSLGLSAEEKKSIAAQEPLGGPPLPHLDCREHENRDQIVSARVLCGLAKPHLNPKTPYRLKKARRGQKIHPREIITFSLQQPMTHLEPLRPQNISEKSEALSQSVCARASRIGPPPAPRFERGVLGRCRRLGCPECIQGSTMPGQVDRFQHVRCVDKYCAVCEISSTGRTLGTMRVRFTKLEVFAETLSERGDLRSPYQTDQLTA